MQFANSWILFFLLLLPIMAILYCFRSNQGNLNLSLASRELSFSSPVDKVLYHLPFLLRLFLIFLVIIILARPQMGKSFTESKHYGLDIFLAVDTSQSMSALDMRWNNQPVDRLEVLKHILESFVLKRDKDRLGLLVFGEKAYTQCPLTLDHGAILDLIQHLEIGMVGNATAIGSAMAVGIKRLKDLEAKSKILILMTDGQNTAGDISPEIATELAEELGIKVYTIGIGQEGEVPFQIDTPVGPMLVKQEIRIDEELLSNIAEKTGGEYYRAKTSSDLQKIYENIDKLEKTEIEVKEYNSFVDIYEKFLWLACLLLLVELLLSNTLLFRIN